MFHWYGRMFTRYCVLKASLQCIRCNPIKNTCQGQGGFRVPQKSPQLSGKPLALMAQWPSYLESRWVGATLTATVCQVPVSRKTCGIVSVWRQQGLGLELPAIPAVIVIADDDSRDLLCIWGIHFAAIRSNSQKPMEVSLSAFYIWGTQGSDRWGNAWDHTVADPALKPGSGCRSLHVLTQQALIARP